MLARPTCMHHMSNQATKAQEAMPWRIPQKCYQPATMSPSASCKGMVKGMGTDMHNMLAAAAQGSAGMHAAFGADFQGS